MTNWLAILSKKEAELAAEIDVSYRTTIELARESNSPVEFVCGSFHCGECRECKTCDTVRTAEEWEWRYRDWKESIGERTDTMRTDTTNKEESTHATDKNQ